ncbi:MAG: hypothetical protein H8E66_33580 [Planctomycetes bacterium]|nr:hypothetical protein [Planctomycetota bacterium]
MTVQDKTRWKDWADELRQEMMSGLTPEVTKSVEVITSETATSKSASSLRSVRFWRACQLGEKPNDVLARAGFDIEFQQNEEQKVQEVTLRLNRSWMTILDRVRDRKNT